MCIHNQQQTFSKKIKVQLAKDVHQSTQLLKLVYFMALATGNIVMLEYYYYFIYSNSDIKSKRLCSV